MGLAAISDRNASAARYNIRAGKYRGYKIAWFAGGGGPIRPPPLSGTS